MGEPVLSVGDLVKTYGDFTALDHVSFGVEPGSIFGYLGQNGAGKTTTIRIILGLARPNGGWVRIFGTNPFKDPLHVFDRVGYCPELPTLQGFWTATQLLEFTARQHGVSRQAGASRARELLELIGLGDHADKKIGKYSKGMVQRLAIGQALVNDPELLIMDEPTLGLDPAATVHFRDLFQRLVKDGKTIFLSSHLLDEVQRLASHIAMIHRGRIVFQGTVNEVLSTFAGGSIIDIELKSVSSSLVTAIRNLPYVRDVNEEGKRLVVHLGSDADVRGELTDFLFKQGTTILSFSQRNLRLEEAYLQVLRKGGGTPAT